MKPISAALGCLLLASTAFAAPRATAQLVDHLAAQHEDARIIVVGELHGTVQTPAFVGALAERLAGAGPVTVALEIPQQEQDALDRHLQSDGGADARRALLAGRFWQRPRDRSDGRRSEAMLALLEQLRTMRAGGTDVAIVAFDDDAFHAGDDRDAAMAQRLRDAYAARPQRRMVVLTGNYHARLVGAQNLRRPDGTPITAPPPMASRLRDLPLLSLDIGGRGGSFWGCGTTCGEQPIASTATTADPDITFEAWPDAGHGYDLQVRLPVLTPSPPVVPD